MEKAPLTLYKIQETLGLDKEQIKAFAPLTLLLYFTNSTYNEINEKLDGDLNEKLEIARQNNWLREGLIYTCGTQAQVEVFSKEFREVVINTLTIEEIIEALNIIEEQNKKLYLVNDNPDDAVHFALGLYIRIIKAFIREFGDKIVNPFTLIEVIDEGIIKKYSHITIFDFQNDYRHIEILSSMIQLSRQK